MNKVDVICRPQGFVTITARDGAGRIVAERGKHNVFVDQGREWLASLVSAEAVFTNSHPQVIAYMGFGKGGTLQDVPAERTAQSENAGVTALATHVDLDTGPTVDLAAVSHTILTPPTSVRFTRIITKTEISTTSTGVPLSECALFAVDLANAAGYPSHADIDIGSPPGPTPFLVAYQQFRTLTKTQDISIQFDWELRF